MMDLPATNNNETLAISLSKNISVFHVLTPVFVLLCFYCDLPTKRALMYHSKMLRAAKRISNLNEFVYLAKEISRMLKEEVRSQTRT